MADGVATRPEAPRRSLARTPTQVQVQVPAQAQAQMPSQTRAPVQARAPAQARAREQVQVQVPAKHPEHRDPKERTSSRRAIQKSERRPYPHRPIRLHSAQPNSQRHDA